MKKEIIGIIGLVVAIVLALVLNANCAQTNYPWFASVLYLLALFLFQFCWCALCVIEKQTQNILSIIGANVGLPILIFCIVVAFINIKWWIVLLFLPFSWFVGGRLGGLTARKLPADWLYFVIETVFFSFMLHTFYKLSF